MTNNEKEYLDKTYDMFRKHWIETNNVEESWERTKRLLHWYRIGLKDGASNQYKSEFQEPIDKEELNKLAEQANPYPFYDKSDICVAHSHDGFNEGFIECYRLVLKQ